MKPPFLRLAEYHCRKTFNSQKIEKMLTIPTFRKLTLPLIMSVFAFCATAQDSTNLSITQKIDQLFEGINNEPGTAIGVIHKGAVVYQKGFGLANLDYDIPITPKSIFELGALSMHFTGACILLLENQGKLSLDDPIQKYLTDFPKYPKGQPTIRQCLHHSSGLRDYLEMINMKGQQMDMNFTAKDGIELIKRQKKLTIPPGSDYRYTNTGYLVLAAIVEKISGQTIAEFAKENIFDPIGMTNTFYLDTKGTIIKNRALGYAKDSLGYRMIHPFNFITPGAMQVQTNVEDFLKWMANFEASKIGNPDFMKQLAMQGITTNGDTMSYAVGLEHGPFWNHAMIGHNGYWQGSTAMFLRFYEDDLSIITLSNNSNISAPQKAFQIATKFFEKPTVKTVSSTEKTSVSITPSLKIPTATLQSYCGNYFNDGIGYNRKVYLKNDTLWYANFESPDVALEAISKNEFKFLGTSRLFTIRFEKEEGQPIMYYSNGGRPPIRFFSYAEANYSAADLIEFTGNFQSTELQVTYLIKVEEMDLVLYLNNQEVVRYSSLMNDLFNSPHDGFLQFARNEHGQISGFSLRDYWLGKLDFEKHSNK